MLKRAAKQVGAGFWSLFDSTREAGRCHKIKILKEAEKTIEKLLEMFASKVNNS